MKKSQENLTSSKATLLVFSTREVASLFKTSSGKIRGMCSDGKFPNAYQEAAGRPWEIPIQDILSLGITQEQIDLLLANKNKETKAETNQDIRTLKRPQSIQIYTDFLLKWFSKKQNFWTVIITIIPLIAAIVSSGADWSPAKQQLIKWGVMSEFRTAASDEILIVVSSFLYENNVINTAAHREIKRSIVNAAKELELTNLRVEVSSVEIDNSDKGYANRLGSRYGASMIIWGSVSGVRTTVSFLNLMNPCFCAADTSITETERSQLRNPSQYAQFITTDLPQQLTFLALFGTSEFVYREKGAGSAIPVLEKAVAGISINSTIEGAAEAYFRLGSYHHTIENLHSAENNYDIALKIKPEYWEIYQNRGIIRGALHNQLGAVEDFSLLIEHEPQNSLLYLLRSSAYILLGKIDLATQDYQQYKKLTATSLLDTDEANPMLLAIEGFWLSDLGNKEKSLQYLNESIKLAPTEPMVYFLRGSIHEEAQRYEEAIADFTRAMDLGLIDVTIFFMRGDAYFALEKYDEAIGDFTKYLSFSPTDSPSYAFIPTAYHLRGIALDETGETEKAIQDFSKAISLDSTIADYFNSLAIAYYKLQNVDQAIKNYDKAIELAPEHPEALYGRGVLYYSRGDMGKALADFRKYKSLCQQEEECYDVSSYIIASTLLEQVEKNK